MNVLHVYKTYYPDSKGGLEETIRQICLNTASHRVNSSVFTLTKTGETGRLDREECTVYRSRELLEVASCSISLTALRDFGQLQKYADVIHYHFPWPFADVLHLLANTKQPCLVTYHSDIVRQRKLGWFYSPLMHRFLSANDSIVCTSENYFATSSVLQRYHEKVIVIPIGIDESSYPSATEEALQAVDDQFGEGFYLFVGVLRYYKGLHILLDAIKGTHHRVVIAGSGPTESALKRQAAAGHINNVQFAGHVSEIEKMALLSRCKAVVFPSYLRSEAFGVTLLEGAMCGKPLISTEVGSGTSHVNIDGETGVVVPPGSHLALRRAMNLISTNELMAAEMGANARRRYETLFTGTKMGAAYAKLYYSLVEAAP